MDSTQNLTRIIVVVFIVIIIAGFIINNNSSKDFTVNGELKVNNGNITVTGDGDLTGSVKTEYVTLPDYASKSETYLWADKNTLLWQSGIIGTIPPRESDVFGWTSKLAQTSNFPQLASNATLSQVISAYNNLLVEFYNRGVIFANPTPPGKVVHAYNVFSNPNVTVPDPALDPNDNVPFNNGGNDPTPRKQMAHGFFNLKNNVDIGNITNIDQIQSVQVNFYAEVNRGGLDYSDARFGLQMNDSAQFYYDYANQFVPASRYGDNWPTPIGRNISSGAISNDPNPPTDSNDMYIYDRNTLVRWFCDPTKTDGKLLDSFVFDANWFVGYASATLKRCRFTRFVINYIST